METSISRDLRVSYLGSYRSGQLSGYGVVNRLSNGSHLSYLRHRTLGWAIADMQLVFEYLQNRKTMAMSTYAGM